MESVQLTTADGQVLDGDLAVPAGEPIGGVVVCHPHPLHGGNRHHPVVDSVFRAAAAAGFVALRFDFRAAHGDGVDERLDVAGAVDELVARSAEPIAVVGYSFGAVVALRTAHPAVDQIVAIAPPLARTTIDPPSTPVLVLTPRHDQFTSPAAARELTVDWTDCELDVVESADHFLAGHAADVARRAVAWLIR